MSSKTQSENNTSVFFTKMKSLFSSFINVFSSNNIHDFHQSPSDSFVQNDPDNTLDHTHSAQMEQLKNQLLQNFPLAFHKKHQEVNLLPNFSYMTTRDLCEEEKLVNSISLNYEILNRKKYPPTIIQQAKSIVNKENILILARNKILNRQDPLIMDFEPNETIKNYLKKQNDLNTLNAQTSSKRLTKKRRYAEIANNDFNDDESISLKKRIKELSYQVEEYKTKYEDAKKGRASYAYKDVVNTNYIKLLKNENEKKQKLIDELQIEKRESIYEEKARASKENYLQKEIEKLKKDEKKKIQDIKDELERKRKIEVEEMTLKLIEEKRKAHDENEKLRKEKEKEVERLKKELQEIKEEFELNKTKKKELNEGEEKNEKKGNNINLIFNTNQETNPFNSSELNKKEEKKQETISELKEKEEKKVNSNEQKEERNKLSPFLLPNNDNNNENKTKDEKKNTNTVVIKNEPNIVQSSSNQIMNVFSFKPDNKKTEENKVSNGQTPGQEQNNINNITPIILKPQEPIIQNQPTVQDSNPNLFENKSNPFLQAFNTQPSSTTTSTFQPQTSVNPIFSVPQIQNPPQTQNQFSFSQNPFLSQNQPVTNQYNNTPFGVQSQQQPSTNQFNPFISQPFNNSANTNMLTMNSNTEMNLNIEMQNNNNNSSSSNFPFINPFGSQSNQNNTNITTNQFIPSSTPNTTNAFEIQNNPFISSTSNNTFIGTSSSIPTTTNSSSSFPFNEKKNFMVPSTAIEDNPFIPKKTKPGPKSLFDTNDYGPKKKTFP